MSNRQRINKTHADLVLLSVTLQRLHCELLTQRKPSDGCYRIAEHLQEAAYQIGDAMKLCQKPKPFTGYKGAEQ